MDKVSVIIPIYGVEHFIGRCVDSLMQQTLDEVEYIFVDDVTPDKSMSVLQEILSRYPKRKDHIKILHHQKNRGLPVARNTGLAVATGEYVFHCDSDDFVEPDMLEKMYAAAKVQDADFVWSDWFLSYENTERYMRQPEFHTPLDTLKGLLADAMKYNVWNKLVRRSLYLDNGIQFPAGHPMGEDMTMIRLAACAKSVAYVNQAFYHYVKINAEAMTQSFNERHLADVRYNVDLTLNFLQQRNISNIEKEIAFFKLNVKLPFLITADWKSYRRWSDWYPEANAYIMQNQRLALRTRILQKMAALKCYIGVWIYYMIIYRFLYTILYKN